LLLLFPSALSVLLLLLLPVLLFPAAVSCIAVFLRHVCCAHWM
jgi:hypothetical protein